MVAQENQGIRRRPARVARVAIIDRSMKRRAHNLKQTDSPAAAIPDWVVPPPMQRPASVVWTFREAHILDTISRAGLHLSL